MYSSMLHKYTVLTQKWAEWPISNILILFPTGTGIIAHCNIEHYYSCHYSRSSSDLRFKVRWVSTKIIQDLILVAIISNPLHDIIWRCSSAWLYRREHWLLTHGLAWWPSAGTFVRRLHRAPQPCSACQFQHQWFCWLCIYIDQMLEDVYMSILMNHSIIISVVIYPYSLCVSSRFLPLESQVMVGLRILPLRPGRVGSTAGLEKNVPI